jgi:uncharacterized protein YjbI with pentapeptide repeats
MANDEHVALLKQGVEAWNAWRNENRNIRPDLAGADLAGARLIGAYLRGANLFEVNLAGANLTKARLERADLTGADLTKANLTEADLRALSFRISALLYRNLLRSHDCLPRQSLATKANHSNWLKRATS